MNGGLLASPYNLGISMYMNGGFSSSSLDYQSTKKWFTVGFASLLLNSEFLFMCETPIAGQKTRIPIQPHNGEDVFLVFSDH